MSDKERQLAKVQGIAQGLEREIARLTDDRDRLKKALKEDGLRKEHVVRMQAACVTYKADLAAARAALERLVGKCERNGYEAWEPVQVAKEILSRLGTGEALQAVRGAQRFIKKWNDVFVRLSDSDALAYLGVEFDSEDTLARLDAAFGGLTD